MHRIRPRGTVILSALMACLSGASSAGEFTLEVDNNLSPGRTLYVAIYTAEQGEWDSEPAHKLKHQLPERNPINLPLPLDTGDYAIRAFVDMDGDGTLATGAMGKPKEPFASSVGTGREKPAIRFERSVFTLSKDKPLVALELRYPRGTEGK